MKNTYDGVFVGPHLNLYLVAPALSLHLPVSALNLYLPGPSLQCIYRPWLIKIENSKSQWLHIVLLFLFLLPDSVVTVIVDRNKIKGHLSKKQVNK